MSWEENYRRWLSEPTLNFVLKNELQKIKNKAILADQFYRHLEFGTGGMRGEIGVGTNRMNIYVIRQVTLALARYILLQGEEAKLKGKNLLEVLGMLYKQYGYYLEVLINISFKGQIARGNGGKT